MAIALVQSQSYAATQSLATYTITYTSNVTAGNLLVMVPITGGIKTCTDNLNGGWASATSGTVNTGANIDALYFSNTASGACTITFGQYSGGPGGFGFCAMLYEFSGILTS